MSDLKRWAKMKPSSIAPQKRKELLGALVVDLKALSSLPLINKEDEIHWGDEAEKFRTKLYSTYVDIYGELPHSLEHYLTDSDIRLKDIEYKESQEGFLRELILKLEAEIQK